MVIDSSALLGILLGEPEADALALTLANAPKCMVSAFTLLETAIVMEARKGEEGGRALDILVHRAKIDVVPLIPEHAELARAAWRRYGKGRHPAGLNTGTAARTLSRPIPASRCSSRVRISPRPTFCPLRGR